MFDIRKKLFGKSQYISRTDTHGDDPEPDPNDVWIFTDPDARESYARNGTVKKLEHDIRFEVMRGEPWLPMEIEYKREIRRLLREGVIRDKGTYWHTSPHPTVYAAYRGGQIRVGGVTTRFQQDEDIAFLCRMERDMHNRSVPFIVCKCEPVDKTMLCGEMPTAMKGMGSMGNGGRGGMGGMGGMQKM